MKKLAIFVSLAVSVTPFAFFKMKGICHQWDRIDPENINVPSDVSNDQLDNIFQEAMMNLSTTGTISLPVRYIRLSFSIYHDAINCYFIYNEDTGYTIAFLDIDVKDLVESFSKMENFFKKGISFLCHSEKNLSFIFVEEQTNLKITKEYWYYKNETRLLDSKFEELKVQGNKRRKESVFKEKIPATGPMNSLILMLENYYYDKETKKLFLNKEFIDSRGIKLSKDFETGSGVFISNKDGYVEITKGGKTVKFQDSLYDHFDADHKNIKLAESIKNSLDSNEGISSSLLDNIQLSPFKKEFKLLNKSTIISVFAVIKDKRGRESIIWGLAEDKVTGKRFHWVTDLEDDVSILIDQHN